MGRYGVGTTLAGVVKSVQTFSTTGLNGGTTTTKDVTISSVDTAKSVIIKNSSSATSYGANANDQDDQSYGMSSPTGASLTSSTNLRLYMRDLDGGIVYGRITSQERGFVVEYT